MAKKNETMLSGHVITDEAIIYLEKALAENKHWLAYNTLSYFLEKTDVYLFASKEEARAFCADNISDYDNFSVVSLHSLADTWRNVPDDERYHPLAPDPDANGLYNRDGNAFTDALIDDMEAKQFIHSNKTKVMNEKNFDYLKDQMLKMGFGEGHQEELKTKLQSGAKEFVIGHNADYGKDSTAATLQFRKSDNNDMYFFNTYNLLLKNAEHPEPLKQTFYVQDHFSLKEGYNLLAGRAVLKEKENKEGQQYTAWFQLDFKQTEKNGNYKLHPYHSNYGYDLEKVLQKHTIKELNDPTQREYLMKALQRGNRQSINLLDNGQEKKMFIEASPQYKSLNFYNAEGERLKAGQVYTHKTGQHQGTTVKEQADQLNEKAANQSKQQDEKKDQQKKMNSDDGDGPSVKGEQKSRRSRQSIS